MDREQGRVSTGRLCVDNCRGLLLPPCKAGDRAASIHGQRMDPVSGCKFPSNAKAVVAALTWSHKKSKALLNLR